MAAACQPKAAAPLIIPVSTTKIQARSFEEVIQAEGTLTTPTFIQVKPQTSGVITQVFVKEGDTVNAGDLLFTLENKEELAELKATKEELKLATIQAQRYRYFARVGAGSNFEAEEKRLAAVAAQSLLLNSFEELTVFPH